MYTILKSVIMSKKNTVSQLYHKVDVAWANGDITDDEKIELEQLIFKYKNPETESPDLTELYNRLKNEVDDLKTRVTALETNNPENPETSEIVSKWEPWDGISDNYQYGAVVTHNGKYFINVLRGMQNTWEQESLGIDERYWKEITKEQAESIIKGDMSVEDVIGGL